MDSATSIYPDWKPEEWTYLDYESPVQDAPYDSGPQRAAAQRKAARPRPRVEGAIVADVIKHIQSLEYGYARKVHGSAHGQIGEPDVDACVEGRAVKLEGKTGHAKPTVAQHEAMVRWRAAGALTGWFRSVQDALDVLEHVADRSFEADLTRPGCGCSLHARPRS